MAKTRANGSVRSEKSKVIHTSLDDAAALINAAHARILSDVIEARDWNIHRDVDGVSALRAWLMERFDFHVRTAADIAAIARLSKKFRALAAAACAGEARIDPVAFAVRQLDKTPAMRVYARTPYAEPVPSPWNASVACPTPEHLIAQYCAHATFDELATHLAELAASLAESAELFD
ncbi:hypothetical protein L0U85_19485, partial [Glycomyces sp. L485]|uniref:hypothetical protein n=1 Tax=Glycomyces sp. L485 TaxID=2909235 RepID=UPI001F4BBE39